MNSDGSETGLENRGQAKPVGIDTSVPRQYAESTSKALDSPAKRCVAIRLFGSCPRLRASFVSLVQLVERQSVNL